MNVRAMWAASDTIPYMVRLANRQDRGLLLERDPSTCSYTHVNSN